MPNFWRLSIALAIVMTYSGNSFAKPSIKEWGDFTQVIVPVYALGMTAYKKDGEGATQLVYSFAATQATVHGLKYIIDAERPDGSANDSFPSGHTASAFSGATFIHKRYGLESAIVPYLLAGFTGYSRIYADKHYFHDVLAGAVISGLFTWLFVSEYDSGIQLSVGPDSVNLGFPVNESSRVQLTMSPESVKFGLRIEF